MENLDQLDGKRGMKFYLKVHCVPFTLTETPARSIIVPRDSYDLLQIQAFSVSDNSPYWS